MSFAPGKHKFKKKKFLIFLFAVSVISYMLSIYGYLEKEEVDFYTNYDLENITTPVKVKVLHQLLKESDYPEDEMNFLVEGFIHGFDIGYEGPALRQDVSRNLPLRVGSKLDIWQKVMKEVKAKHLQDRTQRFRLKTTCSHL